MKPSIFIIFAALFLIFSCKEDKQKITIIERECPQNFEEKIFYLSENSLRVSMFIPRDLNVEFSWSAGNCTGVDRMHRFQNREQAICLDGGFMSKCHRINYFKDITFVQYGFSKKYEKPSLSKKIASDVELNNLNDAFKNELFIRPFFIEEKNRQITLDTIFTQSDSLKFKIFAYKSKIKDISRVWSIVEMSNFPRFYIDCCCENSDCKDFEKNMLISLKSIRFDENYYLMRNK